MEQKEKNFYFCTVFNKRAFKVLTCGVTGNTSDFGSEESRFEPWQVNQYKGSAIKNLHSFFHFSQ